MKKYLIIPLIAVMLLMGCEQKNKSQTADANETQPVKSEVFSKCLKEKDLDSYVLKVNGEEIIKTEDKSKTDTFEGTVEMIKEPLTYYAKWQNKDDEETHENQLYVKDDVRYLKDSSGKWTKETVTDEKNSDEEKAVFMNTGEINPNTLLEKLENYFELTESEDSYIAKLQSNSDNIGEINNILFKKSEGKQAFGELTSLKVELIYEKDTFYPVSFKIEISFENENKETTEIKEAGNYEKVNKLDSIETPEEIKNL